MKQPTLKERIRRVRMVVFDVDGVLTDGRIIVTATGEEIKFFSVLDGAGITYLERAGIRTAILSARESGPVIHRAKDLGIRHVLQGFHFKMDGLRKLEAESGVGREAMCHMGDDLPDIPVMREVALAVSVPNGRPEVRKVAHWVTRARGGDGAARELAERILKTQRLWGRIVARYGLRGSGGAAGGAL